MFSNYEQNNWSELLSMTEFSYNNSITSATGLSLFYANYGYHPETHWLVPRVSQNPAANIYIYWLQEVHQQCLERLERTRNQMGKHVDPHRAEHPPFQTGDKVLINAKNMRTRRPSKKLNHRYLGPFPITKLIGVKAV